jgi:hypothetical protein
MEGADDDENNSKWRKRILKSKENKYFSSCCQKSRPQSRGVVGKVSDKFDDYLKRTGGRK